MTSASHDAQYWCEVGEQWVRNRRDRSWRMHCDELNGRLLADWLPRVPIASLLKTDLFDEALTGGMFPRLRARADVVVGMDLSHAIARTAATRCPGLRAVRADARRLPFAAGSFDVVVSLSTLDHFHHKEDLAVSLDELGRITRPSGSLLLTLDNPTHPIVALRNVLPFGLLNRLALVPYFVGTTASLRGIQPLLDHAGFAVIETRTLVHCPRVLAVPICNLLDRLTTRPVHVRWLRALRAMERLADLPTRTLTGHYIAVLARKR